MRKSAVRTLLLAMTLAAATAFTGCTDVADEQLGGVSSPDLSQTAGSLGGVPSADGCVTSEMAGICRTMSTWKAAAAKRCISQGMELSEIHATAECESGRVSAVSYTCCPPDPDPCQSFTRTTKLCKSEPAWLTYATQSCAGKGMILSDFAVSGPCGKGRWNTVTYRCCPDTDVCCETAAGPQVTPASKCPPGAALPPSMCKAQEVCCKLPDGSLLIMTADQCKAKGGGAAPLDMCMQEVCCETAAGYQIVPASKCPSAAIVSMDLCKPIDVCCKLDGGYFTVPSTQCPASQIVSPDLCKPVEFCCTLPDGTMVILTADDCKLKGGQAGPIDLCDPKVCCETAAGYQVVPASQCPNAQVPMDLCAPQDVCCKLPDGTFAIMSSADCKAKGGAVAPIDMCAPPTDVCCVLPDGTVMILSADKCKSGGGTVTSMDKCDPSVCCETPVGYMVVPASVCPNAQVAMELCATPADICCSLPDGTYAVMSSGDCAAKGGTVAPLQMCASTIEVCCVLPDGTVQVLFADKCLSGGGTLTTMDKCDPAVCCETAAGYQVVPASQCPNAQVPMDLCKPTDVCCKLGTGYVVVPSTQCPTGQVAPMDLCMPVDKICCLLPDGTIATMTADDCKLKGGAPTSMSDCDPSVCCETAAGYMVVPASQCPNAQVSMDHCKPTDVCCKLGTGYVVVPSTQCPTGQAVPMDMCNYTPCDLAVFGQCKGFDYAPQCDPNGFDCGPFGILGDLDCDGKYEVCIACPPGTHPVDQDGDGCEEMCDCCEPIICPANMAPVDTNKDGCPDTCEIALCDQAISGQCKGFDYAGQCDPTGYDCTSFAILGDTNCDGKYDVCMECPAGTVPMDLDGDGCEEVCNCPLTDPPIK